MFYRLVLRDNHLSRKRHASGALHTRLRRDPSREQQYPCRAGVPEASSTPTADVRVAVAGGFGVDHLDSASALEPHVRHGASRHG